jgi:hypothetical protein
MQLKKQALDEANAALDALRASRAVTEYKMRHFLSLLGEALTTIPDEKTDYQELDEMIETPSTTDNTYKLVGFELTELSKALDANDANSLIGNIEALAGALRKFISSLPMLRKTLLLTRSPPSQISFQTLTPKPCPGA